MDRFAPERLKPWLRLIRADRPIGAWLLLWPCWWSVALAGPGGPRLSRHRSCSFSSPSALSPCAAPDASITTSSTAISMQRWPGRKPVRLRADKFPSAPRSSLIVALCLVGLGVLIQFNVFAICAGLRVGRHRLDLSLDEARHILAPGVPWASRSPGARSWDGRPSFGSLGLAPVILYAASVAWTIGYDTIYAHQDREDDAIIGLKSTALRFGKNTPAWLSLFYGITVGGLAFSGWMVGAGVWFFFGMALAARISSGRWRRSTSTTPRTASTASAATTYSAPSCFWPSSWTPFRLRSPL